MKKLLYVLLGIIGVIVILAGALIAWAYRPWADYHPLQIFTAISSGNPVDRAYVFGHWDKVLPYSTIKASSNPIEFTRDVRPMDVTYQYDGKSYPIDNYIKNTNVAAMLVLSKGKVVFEKYYYDLTPESRYHIYSATKSFLSTMVGIALKEGKIGSLDDRVDKYAPQFNGTAYGETTIRHLMMMSSGINYYHHKGFPNQSWIYIREWGLGQNPDEFAVALKRGREQGTDLNYLAIDSHVLSRAISGAYGKPIADVAYEKLWQPLGMNRSAIWSQSEGKDGVAFGQACLCPTLSNLALLGQLYVQDGVWNGQRVLPEGWVKQVGTPSASFQEPAPDSVYPYEGYGMQFWVPIDYKGEFFAYGAFGQFCWIDTVRGVVIAQFGAGTKESESSLKVQGEKALERINAFRAISAKAAELTQGDQVTKY